MKIRKDGSVKINNMGKIFIMTHKKFQQKVFEGYSVLEVGADCRNNHWGYLLDNEGDNISKKNSTFCELTGLYWIWKNINDDYIGICHYRRYFSKYRAYDDEKFYINEANVYGILKDYDIILPEPFYWNKHTVETGYYECGCGYKKDLTIIREIIRVKYPDYLASFDNVLRKKHASYCNMFVMKKEKFDQYCEWLFNILFEAEKKIDISQYSVAEKRIFGYLSEILLNIWVDKNKLKIKYCPMVVAEDDNWKHKVLGWMEYRLGLHSLCKCLSCKDSFI